jgi:hypothetical protein
MHTQVIAQLLLRLDFPDSRDLALPESGLKGRNFYFKKKPKSALFSGPILRPSNNIRLRGVGQKNIEGFFLIFFYFYFIFLFYVFCYIQF